MKKNILLLLLLLLFLATGHLVYAEKTLIAEIKSNNLDFIDPGKAGWDYIDGKYLQVEITCSMNEVPWNLMVNLDNLNSGSNTFEAQKNIKLKVFYIGHSKKAEILDPLLSTWEDHTTDYLKPEFSGYDPGASFVDYNGTAMQICGNNAFPAGMSNVLVRVVLGVTVQVPEGGRNITGDYLGRLRFTLN
ncbi:MAG: hypothetical protein DKM50_09980 [Candidatus Margulisiibacteriota bacterium]|nr:MAG: hypothetical protein A2X43_04065 [Candidatus Margulisbacteria bacterium GWD2_39_127]OGI05176.1 MAG: hypothetical protein A2X42_02575 [Candidatus Margulisbacteria bacterium GWF2_38_17]OGI06225.1 MAG: hypothetical protein A2X41_08155 [Candidatus Margulisbacteria bacterium GWE2_39_32]PZM78881.1 MAG: hypothetical protein DKM50_09980 [Candidatus Margulisiibacteriota bacterium]HAR64537.1 hypothetical protein [Candidatus Margulisiibacteriota bacterium]